MLTNKLHLCFSIAFLLFNGILPINNKEAKEIIESVGTLNLKPENIKEKSNFDIPKSYISDTSFIGMTTKNPTPKKIIYASPSGSGDGTEAKPYSISKAVENLREGYTLYLKGGKYDVGRGLSIGAKGSSSAYIVISSAPGEEAIITSSSSSTSEIQLFEINGAYIIIENITFKDCTAKNVQGIVLYTGGQNHIIIRNNVFDSLKTTKIAGDYGANAILLMGENTEGIKQVMIFGNTVTNNVLGYSEGISVAGNCEEIYILLNLVKNNTNIGIDYYGNAGYCSKESLDQPRKSVAMYNYIASSVSPYASCAGLYIDGAKNILVSDNTIIDSQYGIEIGSEEKNEDYPVTDILVQRNYIKDNKQTGIRIGGYEEDETGTVQETTIKSNYIEGTDEAIIISKAKNIYIEENDIYTNGYFTNMEFSSKYTKDITFTSNTFYGAGRFKMYGSEKLTLDQFIKQYPTNIKGK